jgi:hypothetical protein
MIFVKYVTSGCNSVAARPNCVEHHVWQAPEGPGMPPFGRAAAIRVSPSLIETGRFRGSFDPRADNPDPRTIARG